MEINEETATSPTGGSDVARKRKRRLRRIAQATKVSFSLEPDVRQLFADEAKKQGMELGHLMQKVLENHVLENAEPGNALAERLRAKRAVIDHTVELARMIDAAGRFDEHFILTVMRSASQDAAYAELYNIAIGADAEGKPGRAQAPLNQQLGRLIKKAVGARGKKSETGRVARAQVAGEVISTYTLLEKAA
ncbi:hypothetical protein [Primorskyibacter marinus]|uniref:hypothetical protein n=1 Tax=Primorskyibacter marinus TaxID=1977320 RepID=UPI000E30178E|nr:hypothetical protein [Primorskyibacter marinus]